MTIEEFAEYVEKVLEKKTSKEALLLSAMGFYLGESNLLRGNKEFDMLDLLFEVIGPIVGNRNIKDVSLEEIRIESFKKMSDEMFVTYNTIANKEEEILNLIEKDYKNYKKEHLP